MVKSNPRESARVRLDHELERLQKAIEQQQGLVKPQVLQVGDEVDRAVNQVEHGKETAVLEQLRQLMSRVQYARARLGAGLYGICEDCRQAIPCERLEALPYATLCVRCQSKREAGIGKNARSSFRFQPRRTPYG